MTFRIVPTYVILDCGRDMWKKLKSTNWRKMYIRLIFLISPVMFILFNPFSYFGMSFVSYSSHFWKTWLFWNCTFDNGKFCTLGILYFLLRNTIKNCLYGHNISSGINCNSAQPMGTLCSTSISVKRGRNFDPLWSLCLEIVSQFDPYVVWYRSNF